MGDDVKKLTLMDAEKYNKMMTFMEQLVTQRKILDDVKRTQTEAELIDSHDGMMKAVKRAPATAMSDIVNYTKKKENT
jgi:hypothetical protein